MISLLRCLPPTTLGDATALDAARRLKRELPWRIHRGMPEEPRENCGHKRAVIVQGEIYKSIRKAAEAHKVSNFTMHKWLQSGKASYFEE